MIFIVEKVCVLFPSGSLYFFRYFYTDRENEYRLLELHNYKKGNSYSSAFFDKGNKKYLNWFRGDRFQV